MANINSPACTRRLKGRTFGYLTALRITDQYRNKNVWLCRCRCGNECEVTSSHLTTGHTRSCGCLKAETMSETTRRHGHSMSNSPEYHAWKNLRRRAELVRRWNDFAVFLKDVGPRPSAGHRLRITNQNKPAGPGNVRWE